MRLSDLAARLDDVADVVLRIADIAEQQPPGVGVDILATVVGARFRIGATAPLPLTLWSL